MVKDYVTSDCPAQLFLELKGNAHMEVHDFAGQYENKDKSAHGVPKWIRGNYAIWFKKNLWQIGPESDILNGGTSDDIQSIKYQGCPNSTTKWKYFRNSHGKLMEGSQGEVKVVSYKGTSV